MNSRIVYCLVACASAIVLDKKQLEAEQMHNRVESENHATAAAMTMRNEAHAKLAYFLTEEGKKVHDKAVKAQGNEIMQAAAEEMEWLSDVARDGFYTAFDGSKYPLYDPKSPEGKLPKGLPEIPKDPADRQAFIKEKLDPLGIGVGMYDTMLALKKHPSALVEMAQDKFQDALSSLLETSSSQTSTEEKPQALAQIAERRQNSIEVLKASPKTFKTALKAWEKMVPEAASMLLQTQMTEDPQEAKSVFLQAKELANRATALHQVVFDSVEQVTNKDNLMSVAQNRITSLLMRQSEASLSDFDALEGCNGQAKDYSGSEARCLCVVDNICSKAGQGHGGEYCSIVSSATCMSPKNEKEASEMSTV